MSRKAYEEALVELEKFIDERKIIKVRTVLIST